MNGSTRGLQVHVVAGALIDDCARILIAQRPAGKHMAGFWEFPGGKLERGESRRAGLERELYEELGVAVCDAHPLIGIRHAYGDRRVYLDIWRVQRFAGAPRGREGQALRWCDSEELADVDLLPADRPVVTALRLPDRLTSSVGANFELAGAERFADVAPGGTPSGMPSSTPAGTAGGTLCEAAGGAPSVSARKVLRGALCAGVEVARLAAAGGADFVALQAVLPLADLQGMCDRINVPVYGKGIELEAAWSAGARGTIEI